MLRILCAACACPLAPTLGLVESEFEQRHRLDFSGGGTRLLISVQNFPGFRGKQRPKVSTPACVTIWLFAGETWGVIHGLHRRNPAPSFC